MRKNYKLSRGLLLIALFITATFAYAQPTFINKLQYIPIIDMDNVDTIKLDMIQSNHKFNPGGTGNKLNGVPSTQPNGIPTYSYNLYNATSNTILGPTLRWHTGSNVSIKVRNLLPDSTTTHWHGAEVPAKFDGGPHNMIPPTTTWEVNFKNLDSTATLWYHPHFHNTTVEQVQMGLSGMIISEQRVDPIRDSLPHTYWVDDFPIIIGDMNTSLDTATNTYNMVLEKGKRPVNLVNGVTNPYIELPAQLVRLRILNGSTRKGINFAFSTSKDTSGTNFTNDTISFMHIATDGGYVNNPMSRTMMLMGPGERNEIVLDLRTQTVGDSVFMLNLSNLLPNYVVGSTNPPSTPNGGGQDVTGGKAFLKIKIVGDSAGHTYQSQLNTFTSAWEPSYVDTTAASMDRIRYKELLILSVNGGANAFVIKGIDTNFTNCTYDMMRIDDIVCVGSRETWVIWNRTPVAHPFHIHKIFFRVISAFDTVAQKYLNIDSLGWNGPKDDILVPPHTKVAFLGVFDDYPTEIMHDSTYMYHCHILTHEDIIGGGMMHQFVVASQPECNWNVGVEEQKLITKDMQIYPNPASGELYLNGKSATQSTVRIVDLQGRLIKEQKKDAFEGSTAIDIKGLSAGIYVLQWNTQEGTFTQKLVIE